jgi:hypothetical protein
MKQQRKAHSDFVSWLNKVLHYNKQTTDIKYQSKADTVGLWIEKECKIRAQSKSWLKSSWCDKKHLITGNRKMCWAFKTDALNTYLEENKAQLKQLERSIGLNLSIEEADRLGTRIR